MFCVVSDRPDSDMRSSLVLYGCGHSPTQCTLCLFMLVADAFTCPSLTCVSKIPTQKVPCCLQTKLTSSTHTHTHTPGMKTGVYQCNKSGHWPVPQKQALTSAPKTDNFRETMLGCARPRLICRSVHIFIQSDFRSNLESQFIKHMWKCPGNQ